MAKKTTLKLKTADEQEPNPVAAEDETPFAAEQAEPAMDVADDDLAVDAEEVTDDDSEAPEARIDELEAAAVDLKDKLLRALAETENIRRRATRERQDASKYAIAGFAREILAVADNLRRALEVVDDTARGDDPVLQSLCAGVEMTEKAMLESFERVGIQRIQAMGARFDHNQHEALFEMEDPSQVAGTVVQVIEAGYMLHDRLLRPAKVGVSRGGPKEAPAAEESAAKSSAAAYEKKAGAGAKLDQET